MIAANEARIAATEAATSTTEAATSTTDAATLLRVSEGGTTTGGTGAITTGLETACESATGCAGIARPGGGDSPSSGAGGGTGTDGSPASASSAMLAWTRPLARRAAASEMPICWK